MGCANSTEETKGTVPRHGTQIRRASCPLATKTCRVSDDRSSERYKAADNEKIESSGKTSSNLRSADTSATTTATTTAVSSTNTLSGGHSAGKLTLDDPPQLSPLDLYSSIPEGHNRPPAKKYTPFQRPDYFTLEDYKTHRSATQRKVEQQLHREVAALKWNLRGTPKGERPIESPAKKQPPPMVSAAVNPCISQQSVPTHEVGSSTCAVQLDRCALGGIPSQPPSPSSIQRSPQIVMCDDQDMSNDNNLVQHVSNEKMNAPFLPGQVAVVAAN